MLGDDAHGALALGELRSDLREGSDVVTPFERLLDDPDAERRFLVILEPYDPEAA